MAALLTAPWWVTIATRHGLSPFLSAAHAAAQDSPSWFARVFSIWRLQFTGEPYLPFAALLMVIGLFATTSVAPRALLSAWLFFTYVLEPRGGTLFMMVPGSMLAGLGLQALLQTQVHNTHELPIEAAGLAGTLRGRQARLFLGFLSIYMLVAGYVTPLKVLQRATLQEAQLSAMRWIRDNTSPDSAFLLVTNGQPLLDPASDWFPALAERVSLATVFGQEWKPGLDFGRKIDDYNDLQACTDEGTQCLEAWAWASGKRFTHVYFGPDASGSPLARDLGNSTQYRILFFRKDVLVAERIR
jgi:hypothetical protein